ncbi:MAG: monomeric [FeFe] hydrogenase [Ruminococcus sp.]|nr:monomeric [FeFe] hydrogenase [Ruminococcus sp.]
MKKIRKFDTKVQHLNYKVIREVARKSWASTLMEGMIDIPKIIVPGSSATMRCCVYKERAIVSERVKIGIGGDSSNPNVIEVIDIACDECPKGGYTVGDLCRGCLAHRCEDACPKGAITYDSQQKAHIDKSKCVECGQCAKVCPYNAIINRIRPCEMACKVKAISMDPTTYAASIDNNKCISCGACVYQCPFGAIMSKSFVINVIDIIKKSKNNTNYNVYAVVAPAVSSQFKFTTLGKVIGGIKALGFHKVVEAALGADMVAHKESKELAEKGFLMSSCCPAFVDYVHKNFPQLSENLSENLSPAATIAKHIKEKEPTAKVVFIGPCTAKKAEARKPEVRPYIDSVITFEELQALFDSRDIDITETEEESFDGASYFGRIFARSGGLTDAVRQGIFEHGINFDYKPMTCSGIEECRMALLRKNKNVLPANFIEGMACVGGCVGGAGCLTHSDKNRSDVDKYGRDAMVSIKTIADAVNNVNND